MLTVGAGWVSPAVFWKMQPFELWWLIEAKGAGRKTQDNFGMSDALIQELSDLLDAGHF